MDGDNGGDADSASAMIAISLEGWPLLRRIPSPDHGCRKRTHHHPVTSSMSVCVRVHTYILRVQIRVALVRLTDLRNQLSGPKHVPPAAKLVGEIKGATLMFVIDRTLPCASTKRQWSRTQLVSGPPSPSTGRPSPVVSRPDGATWRSPRRV